MFKQIAYLFLFLFGTTVFSQVEEVQAPNYIKTITFKGNTPESQLPVLSLGDFVVLEFETFSVYIRRARKESQHHDIVTAFFDSFLSLQT